VGGRRWHPGRGYAELGDVGAVEGYPDIGFRYNVEDHKAHSDECKCCGAATTVVLRYKSASHFKVQWPICKDCKNRIEIKLMQLGIEVPK